MQIQLLVDGGDMKPGPSIGQKLGPLGINIGKVIQEVNSSTSSFKGMKVPVILDIDSKTKNFTVKVMTPPTSQLLKKEAGIEKGSGIHKKLKVGNLAIEQVISVAKIKKEGMLANDFKSVVKSVLGTCQSLGILIEGIEAKELIGSINKGKYLSEIKDEKTTVDEKKKQKLIAEFEALRKKQEEQLKKEEEAKAAEEAAKAAAAAAAPTAAPAPGAAPAPTAVPGVPTTAPTATPAKGKEVAKEKAK